MTDTIFRKLEDPTYCPSGYSLDLYCDHENPDHDFHEFPHGYLGETGPECRRQAKTARWTLHRDNTATCPKCSSILDKAAIFKMMGFKEK